jgi:2'-5' RNA ligase/N-acetylglutamate synthase-like GNAT family acetyltransferase
LGERRRLTVSLLLQGDVGREVDGLRRALGAGALERIEPHVTLVPPVNVKEEDLEAALRVFREAAVALAPLRLELGPPATFLPRTPVVYLEVGGDLEELSRLRDLLSKGPLSPPAGREERDFVPHVTLDQKIAPERAPAVLEALADYRQRATVNEVSLLQFDEATRRWEVLAAALLGGRRVVSRGGLEASLEAGSLLDPSGLAFVEAEWAAYSKESYGAYRPERPFAITARRGEEVVGTATGQIRPGLIHLANLVVAARERRQGIGAQLVRAVEQLGRENGARRVRLETRAGGPAEDFYRRLGYEATDTLASWHEERDFFVMEKTLSQDQG